MGLTWLGYLGDAKEIEYEVHGTMDWIVFEVTGAELANTIDFRVVSLGPQWWIFLKRHKFSDMDCTQAASDGTNCFYLVDMTTTRQRALAEGKVRGPNNGSARIIPGIVPRFEPDGALMTIWFAYLSHTYLDRNLDSKIPPPEVVYINDYNTATAIPQHCQLSRFSSPPRLPQKAVFWEDGLIRARPSNLRGQKDYKPQRWPKPYDRGFTNVIYVVETWTNMGDIQLPIKSYLFCYIPKLFNNTSPPLNGNDLQVYKKVSLQTLFAQPSSSREQLLPDLPGFTFVRDERFTNAGLASIDYAISNNWFSELEVKQLPEYHEALASRRFTLPVRPAVHRVFIAVLFLLLVGFPLLVWLFWRRTKQQGPETNPTIEKQRK